MEKNTMTSITAPRGVQKKTAENVVARNSFEGLLNLYFSKFTREHHMRKLYKTKLMGRLMIISIKNKRNAN
jgi:hypothetical protein